MVFDEQAAIDRFWQARCSGEFYPGDWVNRLSIDQAYRIQLGIIARRVAAGERQVGCCRPAAKDFPPFRYGPDRRRRTPRSGSRQIGRAHV